MKKLLALALAPIIAGCGSSLPIEQRYARNQWATMSVQQAEAECHVQVQSNPFVGFPVCMRAKGWDERR